MDDPVDPDAGEPLAGIVCGSGLVILVWRRLAFPRVRPTTTNMDIAVYLLLVVIITLGEVDTLWFNTIQGGYDYRHTVAEWFRGIFLRNPRPDLMAGAPFVYQRLARGSPPAPPPVARASATCLPQLDGSSSRHQRIGILTGTLSGPKATSGSQTRVSAPFSPGGSGKHSVPSQVAPARVPLGSRSGSEPLLGG